MMRKGSVFEIQWTPPPAVRVLDEELGQQTEQAGSDDVYDDACDDGDLLQGGLVELEGESKNGQDALPRVEIVLQRAQHQPLLEFGSLPALNETDTPYEGEIILVNESPNPVGVRLERFSTRHGFEIAIPEHASVDGAHWTVPAEGSRVCRISWKPTAAGGVRQSVQFGFLNAQRRRVHAGAFVCGVAQNLENTTSAMTKKRLRAATVSSNTSRNNAPGKMTSGISRTTEMNAKLKTARQARPRDEDAENRPRRTNAAAPLRDSGRVNRGVEMERGPVVRKPTRTTARPAAALRLQRRAAETEVASGKKKLAIAGIGSDDLKTHQIKFDELWMEKQEKGFAAWLNFVMDPEQNDVAAAAEEGEMARQALAELARKQRQAALQRKAFMIMHSEDMQETSLQIDREIASGGISIRADRDMFKDLGLRRLVLDMIFCYQDAWLRIGLNTVLGGHTLQHHTTARRSLKRFATTYFLGDPELDEEYRDTRKGLFDENPEYKQELRRRTLRRFLKLVIFLDRAKQASLIDHPSCLFRVDAPIKSSADMLINFAKEFLAGEGNVLRHMQNSCGYSLHHVQRTLDEFDFRVTNLAVDLRDGLRLTRAVELLTENKERSLSDLMRVPAVSRLQKLHNTDVALKELERSGINLSFSQQSLSVSPRSVQGKMDTITNRDIVDGDRRKTLALLWKMILKWKLDVILPQNVLAEETQQIRSLHGKTASRILSTSSQLAEHHKEQLKEQRRNALTDEDNESNDEESKSTETTKDMLLKWCQVICAHHGLRVSNLTTSMASGRALCLLIHHYHPGLLPREAIKETAIDICRSRHPDSYPADLEWSVHNSDDMSRSEYRKALDNERANFQLVNECAAALGSVPVLLPQFDSENIPEEKMMMLFVSYLCSRLLVSRDEIVAAKKIQRVWICYRQSKYLRELGERSLESAVTAQKTIRMFLAKRRANKMRQIRKLQAFVRGYPVRIAYCELRNAAIKLQSFFRYRATYEIYNAVLSMITQVQATVRRHQACRHLRLLKQQTKAAICIQAQVRGHAQRVSLMYQMSAAVSIQALGRGFLQRREQIKQSRAVTKIQGFTRGTVLVRHGYLGLRNNVITMQALCRGRQQRKRILAQHQAATSCQSIWRCHAATKSWQEIRCAVISLQSHERKRRCVATYRFTRDCAITIQRITRGYIARMEFTKAGNACIKMQSFFRMAHSKKDYQRMIQAATKIQACIRQDQIKSMYRFVRENIIQIQAAWRGVQLRREMSRQAIAATKIQSSFRGLQARANLQMSVQAATCIQALARRNYATKVYATTRRSIISMQAIARGHLMRRELSIQTTRASQIQAAFRGHIVKTQYKIVRTSTIQVQAMIRRCLAVKAYQHKIENIIQIQALARRWFVRHSLTTQAAHATKIQAVFRAFGARQEYFAMRISLIKIQAFMRSCLMAKLYAQEKQKITAIQAVIRGFLGRRTQSLRNASAIQIQATFRGFSIRTEYLGVREMVVRVQAFTRSSLARKKYILDVEKITTAQAVSRGWLVRRDLQTNTKMCIKVQSVYRSYTARCEYMKARNDVIMVQAFLRRCIIKKLYHDEKQCVIATQAVIRGWLTRHNLRKQSEQAAKIQSIYRSYSARCEFLNARDNVIMVQAFMRRCIMKKLYQDEKQRIIATQAVARGWLMRRTLMKQSKQATKIQSLYRSYAARSAYDKVRKDVITIQAFLRQCITKKTYHDEKQRIILAQAAVRGWIARRSLLQQARSATKMQALTRMYATRNRYLRISEAIISVQSFIRQCLVAKQFAMAQKQIVSSQAIVRGWLARRSLQTKSTMATKIQSVYRMYSIRVQYETVRTSTIIVQAFARQVLARRQLRRAQRASIRLQATARMWSCTSEFAKKRASASAIAATVRTMLARSRMQKLKRVALFTQSHTRRLLAMRTFQEDVRKVVRVQASMRSFIARTKYTQVRHITIQLQSLVRGHMTRFELARKAAAATMVQSLVRGVQARQMCSAKLASIVRLQAAARRFNAERILHKARSCAVQIQAAQRCWNASLMFAEVRRSVCITQSVVRMWLCRRNLAQKHDASIRIQAAWRASKDQQHFRQALRKVTSIQSFVRGYQVRHIFVIVRSAAIACQAATRMFSQKRAYQAQREAAIHAQSLYRGHVVRCEIVRMKECATRIQAWVRGQRELIAYKNTIAAVVCLQAHIRGRQCRTSMAHEDIAATKVQAFVRMTLARANYYRSIRQVVIVQSFARQILASKRAHARFTNVVKVQSVWRRALVVRASAKEYYAAVQIQALVRRVMARRAARAKLAAIVRIQTIGRMIVARNAGERKLHLIVQLQAMYRGNCARRKLAGLVGGIVCAQSLVRMQQAKRNFLAQRAAACKIQRFGRKHCFAHLAQIRSYIKFQAAYRGWKVRQSTSKDLLRIRRRIAAARDKATGNMTLGARTTSALSWLLESNNLGAIRKACEELEVSTRYPQTAELLLNSTAPDVLFALVHSCNRSLPHQKLLEIALHILIQVAKHDRKRNYERLFANKAASASSILDLLQMFRDQVHIFAHALSLLCCFCSDSSRAINYIVDDHELQRRLHQIENIMRRKCDINKQHRSGRPSAVKTERQKKEQLEFRQHAKLKRLLDELDQY